MISRGTKAFPAKTNGYPGGYPMGFIEWVKDQNWWGSRRCHVPCGNVRDPGSVRIDVKKEGTSATHVFDARVKENYDCFIDTFDFVMIDPPYSKDLAKRLYGTEDCYSSINKFISAVLPSVAAGGLIVTLSYEVPKTPKGCELLAIWGIYQMPLVTNMRCFTVWKKAGDLHTVTLEDF